MSAELEQALAALKAKTGDQPMEDSVRLDITDHGALRIDEQGARHDDGSEADCTISGDLETFRAMFDGELNPTSAFMTGKIKVDGDMGVAMKAANVLG